MEMAKKSVDAALALGPDQPYPLAAQVFYLVMNGDQEQALAITRGALAADLEDRWGSDRTFLRTLGNEALRTGNFGEALAWYERRIPAVFEEPPRIDGGNIEKAVGLAHLLQADGQQDRANQILETVITRYDEMYKIGWANFPLGAAKAEALALLGRPDESLDELTRIFNDGWRMRWRMVTEMNPVFDSIRGDPRFQELIKKLKQDIEDQKRAFAASPLSSGVVH